MNQINPISYPLPQRLARLYEDSAVLVAFSGGEDSSVLLHLLANDAERMGFPLYAAHFNHKIRSLDAERDAEFCRREAERLGIPFFLGEADIPALARAHGTSLEEEGRICRYEFFERVMEENGIRILVTAHHADDQVETVLLHMLRGSGVEGLRGILPCRPFGRNAYIVRPLLQVEKKRISLYAHENHISHVVDVTNGDESYARNYLRSQVVPLLYRIQPNLACTVGRLTQNVGQADDLIETEARGFLKNKNPSVLPLDELRSLHPAIRARVFGIAFEEITDGAHLEKVHTDSLVDLAERYVPHLTVSLPRRMCGVIEGDNLVIMNANLHGALRKSAQYSIPLAVGTFSVLEGKIRIDVDRIARKDIDKYMLKDPTVLILPESLADGAVLRSRHSGDRVRVRGMSKSIKKLMNEQKLPLELRGALPLLVRNEEVLWAPYMALADTVKNCETDLGDTPWCIELSLEYDAFM